MTLLERIEKRQQELILLAVIAYNIEAFPPRWIAMGLIRLKKLKEKAKA